MYIHHNGLGLVELKRDRMHLSCADINEQFIIDVFGFFSESGLDPDELEAHAVFLYWNNDGCTVAISPAFYTWAISTYRPTVPLDAPTPENLKLPFGITGIRHASEGWEAWHSGKAPTLSEFKQLVNCDEVELGDADQQDYDKAYFVGGHGHYIR